MPKLVRFAQDEFPAVLKWQALAFMKIQWPLLFERSPLMSETYPVEHDPAHFAIVEGDALLSYAAVMHFRLRHAEEDFENCALGNVLTFPPYRRKGFARQVVDAATAYINQSSADVATLFCIAANEPFYASSGWTALPGVKTLVGSDGAERQSDLSRMMLFVSAKGQAAQERFTTQPLRVAYTW